MYCTTDILAMPHDVAAVSGLEARANKLYQTNVQIYTWKWALITVSHLSAPSGTHNNLPKPHIRFNKKFPHVYALLLLPCLNARRTWVLDAQLVVNLTIPLAVKTKCKQHGGVAGSQPENPFSDVHRRSYLLDFVLCRYSQGFRIQARRRLPASTWDYPTQARYAEIQ